MPPKHHRTIVLSDIHLGASDACVKEVIHFLKKNTSNLLILNGDIIDGWKLKRGSSWKKSYTDFWRLILKRSKKIPVIYCKGNHDDFLNNVFPLQIGKIMITDHYVLDGANGKKYYVTHGDIFDIIMQHGWLKWLAYFGDIGYSILLSLNSTVNYFRSLFKKPKVSLSLYVKQKVKAAVNFISKFADNLTKLAEEKGCCGVIVGHIHCAEIKRINGIDYLNSGDWIESLTALVEDNDGNWEIVKYREQKYAKEYK